MKNMVLLVVFLSFFSFLVAVGLLSFLLVELSCYFRTFLVSSSNDLRGGFEKKKKNMVVLHHYL